MPSIVIERLFCILRKYFLTCNDRLTIVTNVTKMMREGYAEWTLHHLRTHAKMLVSHSRKWLRNWEYHAQHMRE